MLVCSRTECPSVFRSDCASVLGSLHGFARTHGDGLRACIACLVGLGCGETLLGFLECLGREAIGAHGFGDCDGVARFIEFHWQFPIEF